ncbi:MAG: hypothetical protein DDT20_01185 [Firmicutes bacterium]|nr:hypothetical protein [Bacillota bacterium]
MRRRFFVFFGLFLFLYGAVLHRDAFPSPSCGAPRFGYVDLLGRGCAWGRCVFGGTHVEAPQSREYRLFGSHYWRLLVCMRFSWVTFVGAS